MNKYSHLKIPDVIIMCDWCKTIVPEYITIHNGKGFKPQHSCYECANKEKSRKNFKPWKPANGS